MKTEGARDLGAESSDKDGVLTDRGHGAEGGEHMRAHRGLAAAAGPDAGAGAVRRCSPGARAGRRGGGLRHRPRRHVGGSARACGPRPAGDKGDVIGREQIDRGTKRASVAGESPGLGLVGTKLGAWQRLRGRRRLRASRRHTWCTLPLPTALATRQESARLPSLLDLLAAFPLARPPGKHFPNVTGTRAYAD